MITTPKRKRSPEDSAISKFRRMTISTEGSPELKQPVKTRIRSSTVEPRRRMKNDKPIVKQALISDFMKRINKEM